MDFYYTGPKGICPIISDGCYYISPMRSSNNCITLIDESSHAVQIKDFKKDPINILIFKYNKSKNSYSIISLYSYLYLSVQKKEDLDYNESIVEMHTKSDEYLADWILYPIDDKYFTLELKEFNLMLEYDNESQNFVLRPKRETDFQKFKLKVSSKYSLFLGFKKMLCSIIPKNKNPELNTNDDKIFYIIHDKNDGCDFIINPSNGLCLSTTENSTNLCESEFRNYDCQKWIIINNASKEHTIIHKESLFILDNSSNNFQLIESHPCIDQPNDQLFYINEVSHKNNPNETVVNLTELKKVIKNSYKKEFFISESMTRIDDTLFYSNIILNVLEIPLSTVEISPNAFVNCRNIKKLNCDPKWIPLFPNPLNIENIIIPDGVTAIEDNPFSNITNLKLLHIPQSLSLENCDPNIFSTFINIINFIGDPVFLKWIPTQTLKYVNIPSFVQTIPKESFMNCEHLEKVTFLKNPMLEVIEDRAFANCTSLKTISIPKSVNCIAPDAFHGCLIKYSPELTEDQKMSMYDNLTIDSNITIITDEFKKCSNISSLEIPITVTQSEPNILNSFTKLKMVRCHPKWLNNFISENIQTLFIPDGVTHIVKADFINAIHLKLIYIPESVENIEDNSFENCHELVTAKCSLNHLPYLNHNLIKSLILNDDTINLYRNHLERFINLESIILPNTIQYISPNAFGNCKKLININSEAAKKFFNNSATIDKERTRISKEEFQNWINLDYLSIPETINEIEEGTFDDCINLKRLKCDPKWFSIIPKNSVRSIMIPNFVTELKLGQFEGFFALSCIEFPKHIQIKDENIFDSCESLVIIKCTETQFQSLSEKTKNRCVRSKITKFISPIYDFTDNPSLIVDKTSSITMSCRFSHSINLNDELSDSISNTQSLDYPSEMRLDNLDLLVPDFHNYKTYVDDALRYLISGEIGINYKPSSTSLDEISKVCGAICYKIRETFQIDLRTVQIYTIIRLADEILNKSHDESHGSIGEVKTGEGKTLIITVLSIILVIYGRTVDIVTSNMYLAHRDREEQYKYFKIFGISTDILYMLSNDIELIFTPDSDIPQINDEREKYNFNFDAFRCPVVYSTCHNFEHYYNYTLFNKIQVNRDFDVVLIDEIDNMFIDESNTPAISSCSINHPYIDDIFTNVFMMCEIKTSDVIQMLKYNLPNTSKFNEDDVEILKRAAQIALKKERNVDYVIENNQVIVIDSSTGFKKKGYRWDNYVHEMVEIKEGIKPKQLTINLGLISQRGYFNSYKKIAGVTGTIGNETDIRLLQEGYKISTFKVPRHMRSQTKFIIERRPQRIASLFESVKRKVENKTRKGRPVLVIWESIENAEKFLEIYPNAQKILGLDHRNDIAAINQAGHSRMVTVATLAAGRGIDIEIDEESRNAGGLHVIIPMNMKNQRLLEQAAGRAGRNGQPGRVTIYLTEDDKFIEPPQFENKFENLEKIENMFSNYLRYAFPWIIDSPKKHTFIAQPIFPFGCDYTDALNILARCIKNTVNSNQKNKLEIFQDVSYHTVMLAWGIFFTHLSNDNPNADNWLYCLDKFTRFKQQLNVWFPPEQGITADSSMRYIINKLRSDDSHKLIIVCGIEIGKFALMVAFPEYKIIIQIASNVILDGGLEIYRKLKKGEKIDWFLVLSCAGGGFLKSCLINIIGPSKLIYEFFLDIPIQLFVLGLEDMFTGFVEECFKEDDNEVQIVKFKHLVLGFGREHGKCLARFLKDLCGSGNRPIKRVRTTLPEIKVPQLDLGFIRMTMKFAKDAYSGEFDVGDVIQSNTFNDLFRPQFYCLEHSNDLYIIIRGSQSGDDWESDFDAKEAHLKINGIDYYFHYGFYTAANYVLEHIEEYMNRNYQSIYFVGHSYGAGISCVLCFLTKMSENWKDKKIYAMAFAPPPSMSRVPIEIQHCTFIFINRYDMVPYACLYNLANTVKYNGTKIAGKVFGIFFKKLNESAENLPVDIEVLHIRHVFGFIFVIGVSKTTKLSDCRIDELDLPNVLSITIPFLGTDHKMDNYIKAFNIFES